MSNFDTLVNVATFFEARGARKRLEGVAADSRAQLELARRAESAQARLLALRQTMFDARVEAEAFEQMMAERPFNAMGGFMRLTETMDAIPAEDLTELADKEYLLKVKRYIAETRSRLAATLPEGSIARFERFLYVTVTAAPQTRAYAVAEAFLKAFPTSGGYELGRSPLRRGLVAGGLVLGALAAVAILTANLLPDLYDIGLWILGLDYYDLEGFLIWLGGPGLGGWLAYRVLKGKASAHAASIARLEELARKMDLQDDIVRGIGKAKHAEFVAMRDEAVRRLRGTQDELKGPDGHLLKADAALGRFEALIAELKSLQDEFEARESAAAAKALATR